jgi:hypothetical protein
VEAFANLRYLLFGGEEVVYFLDAMLAKELNTGRGVQGAAPVRASAHRWVRRKLRDPAGRTI